ncbi:GH36-type glycosyl hydrolase domain-containing protein [Rossellomorea sp. KS-H15a]|uniref:GH36-type glycosyl hydrolase domain-containing protein n=1 Tax=Rossellomorea sp. KS-H15a TaxID=2963940 RepID=UPI0020C617E7|nr:cellobiose phosphorylase [Rossellomorea sp. KS-H15a]UTE77387.1 cellobiose phosphorylase [Rossellomorea sp. KS-H15a]
MHSHVQVTSGDLQFEFLKTGDLFTVTHKQNMINQLMTNPIDGSLNNLYLRIHEAAGIHSIPLIGVKSSSNVQFAESQVKWTGSYETISYEVTFTLTGKGIWFWDVRLDGTDSDVDVIYGQDLGLADIGAVRSNEAYMSQYIDHKVFQDEKKGYVLCSRQNQPQSNGFPYVQQGSLGRTIGYSTDGFQFYGLTYKETNEPEALKSATLANEVYQYEFAYSALQSEKIPLNGSTHIVFYGAFKENHETAISSLEFQEEIEAAWQEAEQVHSEFAPLKEQVRLNPEFGDPLPSLSMTEEEVGAYFPARHNEEREGDSLLSFFTETHEHVVLKEKELMTERPHGHILMSGQNHQLKEDTITTTSFMYGLFNSQLVVGNTSFNKMMTNQRNHLNVMKTSGQRIYIESGGSYRLLAMPSMFELGFNYARWYYKTADDTIIVTNYTVVDSPEITLHVESKNNRHYRYLVTNQVTMNNHEYEVGFHVEEEENGLKITADRQSESSGTFPGLSYRMKVDGASIEVGNEERIAQNVEQNSASLIVMDVSETAVWKMTIQGLIHGEERSFTKRDMQGEIETYRAYYHQVMNGFKLSLGEQVPAELEKVNALAWWYTHNMLVHYSVPHGLEQYGGAAWGTRDVCQGPTEYFMATQNYQSVKEIIQTVYSHQYEDDGNWPQWFMFDRYYKFQQDDSHGDIIVWPLKVVGDYIAATNDYSILNERIPYTERNGFGFTEEKETLLHHIQKEISYIKENFLHDTFLSSYGDGDWDDTLQPANAQLKKYMASSWTVALTYQVLVKLETVLEGTFEEEAQEIGALARGIQKDFNTYILKDEVIPGFVYMEEPGSPEFMVHPTDTKTGIHYRLLPMNRSIISELFTPEQADSHYQLVKEHLYCPDGVRLMNRPAKYEGGVSTHFKRAEQASNFGREIGLQYVHAHIRYVEAMAKLGKTDEVWQGLQIINPIGLKDIVPNAERRQSNAYFSSSDGKFDTRYEAQERFNELRDGSVPVKGGWRIYSSGPGIYMNQLISNCLGVRQEGEDLIIDPVLPDHLVGLRMDFEIMNNPVTFVYHLGKSDTKRIVVNGEEVPFEPVTNRYRQGGVKLEKQELKKWLHKESNIIELFI